MFLYTKYHVMSLNLSIGSSEHEATFHFIVHLVLILSVGLISMA